MQIRSLWISLILLAGEVLAQAPVAGVAVNGARRGKMLAGWPAELSIVLVGGKPDSPFGLPEKEGSWAGLLTIEVLDASGEAQTWPWQLATPPAGPLRLEAFEKAELHWILPPDFTSQLTPARYTIRVRLDSREIAGGGDWAGRITLETTLAIEPRPETLSDGQRLEELRRMVAYERQTGQSAAALERLEPWLPEGREPAEILALKAELLEDLGQNFAAFYVWSQASEAAGGDENRLRGKMGEDHTLIDQRRAEAFRRLLRELNP